MVVGKMQKSSTQGLLYVVLVEMVYALKPSPYRTVNCSVSETHYYEVTVNDMQNELLVNCRNASLSLEPVVECVQVRTAVLLYVDSCDLRASLPIALLRNLKTLNLVNSFTGEIFFISNLNIETLFIQKATAKELRIDNLLLLKHLMITNMDWKTILGKPFQNLYKLVTLSLIKNQLEHLEEDTFYDLTQLLILNLNDNKLKMLPDNLFKNTQRLDYLFLSRNRFTYLNSSVLSNLRFLTILNISGNMLKDLSGDLLTSNQNLKYIDLSDNTELRELPKGLFRNSRRLNSFYMSNCGLSSLAVDIFRSCPLLRQVALQNNNLKNVSPGTFFSLSLSYLDLSNNSITNLSSNLFGSKHRLEQLNLSRNRLSRIPTNAFSNMFSLVELNLNDNEIDAVNAEDFDFLTNLKKLDLSNNKIKYLHSLGKAKNILFINLSSNAIQALSNISWASYKMKSIDLSNNDIKYFSTEEFSFPINTTIDLQHNKITSLHLSRNTANPLVLYLGFNPFTCNCSLMNFVQFLQSKTQPYSPLSVADVRNLSCNSPSAWKGKVLADITPFHLCPVLSSCPTGCHCFKMKDLKILVNCSASELTDFPTALPPNTSIVHLEDNQIHDFRISNSKLWENVSHIYLDKNELTDATSWIPPGSLNLLSLRKNNLTILPNSLLNFISNAPSFTLDIRDNPWICNCAFLPFKRWFMINLKKLATPDKVLCRRMVNQTAVLQAIQEIPEDAFCKPRFQHDISTQIILATLLALVSLMVVAIIVFYYRYKETILAYLYVHVPFLYCCSLSYVDRNKLYDAFISYTASDRDTILTVVDELETKPPYFKLCIHERDWMAGYPITSQIETSVANSKKTIVVLTKSYLESFWCETEFQTAYLQSLEDRIDRIIIIVKGDLPERDTMPLDVQNLLASKTYLVWGEKWFWEKLRYALPHYASSSTQRKNMEKIEQVEGMILRIRHNK